MNIAQSMLNNILSKKNGNIDIEVASKTNNNFVNKTNKICLDSESLEKQQVGVSDMLNNIIVEFKKDGYTNSQILDLFIVDLSHCYNGENNNAGHIERVMLLASALGFSEGLNTKDVECLIKGVKYHDISRVDDFVKTNIASQSVRDFKQKINKSEFTPEGYDNVLILLGSQDLPTNISQKVISHYGFQGISDYKCKIKMIQVFNDAHKLDKIRYSYKNNFYFSKKDLCMTNSKSYIKATFQLNNIYQNLQKNKQEIKF